MSELKDFQRATVCRIDYLFRSGRDRVLVSDEVGLGKTLVARGTIAKFAKLKKEMGYDLVKIVYICSNSTIADQNLEKLRIDAKINSENSYTSRLSMQHLNIFMQENEDNNYENNIHLIPLTPKTSFNVTNSQGIMDERALMFAILSWISDFRPYKDELSDLLSYDVKNWDGLVGSYKDKVKKCNRKSRGKYLAYMSKKILEYLDNTIYDNKTLRECLFDFCDNRRKYDSKKIKDFIVQLRIMFSDISLDRLNPDLIIMDEFQRFKNLLNGSNEDLNYLSSKFFSLKDVKILMLSATPFKMYSTLDEIDEKQTDDHYSEFFNVMNFLNTSDKQRKDFKNIWDNYSFELKEFNEDKMSFILAKNKAENAMFRNVCRTERITETGISNFIDDEDVKNKLVVSKEDILSYIETQKLVNDIAISRNVPIDYVKSAPYIMSFMKHYKLKKEIVKYFGNNPSEINKMNKKTFWLNKEVIDNYGEISFNNARLMDLIKHVLSDDAEKLLWIPPSKPYYKSKGIFRHHEGFSKTLIFSSWEMVPRMISGLLSYEVERRTIGKIEQPKKIRYFDEDRSYSRFNFSVDGKKPRNMTLFTLIYPSKFLSRIYNPIVCLNRNLSLNDIENEIESKLKKELPKTAKGLSNHGDSRWYYLAPLILDKKFFPNHVESWFGEVELFINDSSSKQTGFSTYLNHLKDYYSYNLYRDLGKQPSDLWKVLCDMAIASPAICAYRCYKNYFRIDSKEPLGLFSTNFARRFIGRMNQPESISVIDSLFKSNSEGTYWKNVLKYSKYGNLQAVFDEYVHMLSSNVDKSRNDIISHINQNLVSALKFKTTSYEFDTYEDFKALISDEEFEAKKLRSHFAVSFTKGDESESDVNRRKSVRDAFNSPFRPFVLSSTSIGQEGLDFHNYCRRIVHWNLPSNPLELEQREGRINRFKCLAIRQNVAKRYGDIRFNSYNIWDELFDKAREIEKADDSSDLIPYWGLNDSEDMIKIERIVPMYPFSNDVSKYERLMEILSLYRLTLGQSRQEELLEHIFKGLNEHDKESIKELFINLSPFYKKDIEY